MVLFGAAQMLKERRVAFIVAECGFDPLDTRHVLFDDIRSYLMSTDFKVFGIYDQQPEWSGEQHLRYANVCFSCESSFSKER